MRLLPTLYKKTSTEALQEWSIGVEGERIITRWGQIDGAIQETQDIIKEGKNEGRSNETSKEEQALAEAFSLWEGKLKRGYVKDLASAQMGKTDAIIEGGIFPMLAKSYAKDGDKIKFPAFAQPKFDGHRCIGVIKDGVASLWSRTRKPILGVPHIIEALETMARSNGIKDLILDGELYQHDYRDRFEELTSFIRQETPKAGHEVVEYHIYDLATAAPFSRRTALSNSFNFKVPLVSVETIKVNDENELMLAFEQFMNEGYEGCMVRNFNGLYVNKRSGDLQKVKEFDDSEFLVAGVETGRGKLEGCAIFVCKTEDGTEFRVKMKGDTEVLRDYFERPETVIGRWLTVQYQGITNKNNVPRFPVGVRFREEL